MIVEERLDCFPTGISEWILKARPAREGKLVDSVCSFVRVTALSKQRRYKHDSLLQFTKKYRRKKQRCLSPSMKCPSSFLSILLVVVVVVLATLAPVLQYRADGAIFVEHWLGGRFWESASAFLLRNETGISVTTSTQRRQQQQRPTFEPPDGRVMVVIGQGSNSLDDYYDNVVTGEAAGANGIREPNERLVPAGTKLYLHIGRSNRSMAREMSHLEKLNNETKYKNVALVVGFSISGFNDEVAEGEFDDEIIAWGEALRELDRPVYLRIGYEFDNPGHNNPDPEVFKLAWKRIVDLFRGLEIRNAVTVFSSTFQIQLSPFAPSFDAYYPGDDYVDWVGFSFWGGPFLWWDGGASGMLDFARRHGKPAMIGESAPMFARLQIGFLAPFAWWFFFQGYFAMIEKHSDVIKAFHYISVDWSEKNDLWRSNIVYWPFIDMDSRIQSSPYIEQRWKQELLEDRYLHSSKELFGLLGYERNK